MVDISLSLSFEDIKKYYSFLMWRVNILPQPTIPTDCTQEKNNETVVLKSDFNFNSNDKNLPIQIIEEGQLSDDLYEIQLGDTGFKEKLTKIVENDDAYLRKHFNEDFARDFSGYIKENLDAINGIGSSSYRKLNLAITHDIFQGKASDPVLSFRYSTEILRDIKKDFIKKFYESYNSSPFSLSPNKNVNGYLPPLTFVFHEFIVVTNDDKAIMIKKPTDSQIRQVINEINKSNGEKNDLDLWTASDEKGINVDYVSKDKKSLNLKQMVSKDLNDFLDKKFNGLPLDNILNSYKFYSIVLQKNTLNSALLSVVKINKSSKDLKEYVTDNGDVRFITPSEAKKELGKIISKQTLLREVTGSNNRKSIGAEYWHCTSYDRLKHWIDNQ